VNRVDLIFRLLLRLYPAVWQAVFGAEMLGTFQEAHAAMRHKVRFCVREFVSLASGAVREWNRLALQSPEPWMRSLEAPVLVFLLYWFGFYVTVRMALWANGPLLFPGSYVLLAGSCGVGAWIVGRYCTVFKPRRFLLTVILSAACLIATPRGVRATESAWINHLQNADGNFHYQLPGVWVKIESHYQKGVPLPFGSNWTLFIQRTTDGRALYVRHSRRSDSPPYGLVTGFLLMLLALYARRTSRGLSGPVASNNR
jgi:hypothetical protein